MSLIAVHFLLSFTVIFSLTQIFIVSFLLWVLTEEGPWHSRFSKAILIRYLFLAVIPMGIALTYYTQAAHFEFHFIFTAEQLIRDSFSRDRLYILFIYILLFGLYLVGKKLKRPLLFKDDTLLKGVPYLLLTVLMILDAFFVIWLFHINDHGTGFPVTSRYFIFLTPIGIIATVLFTKNIIQSLSAYRWVQFVFASGIGYLVIERFLKVAVHIKNFCPWMFS